MKRPATRRRTSSATAPRATKTGTDTAARVEEALAWLKRHSKKSIRDGMARYGIPADHALGVRVGDMQKLAKILGRDHALALALWETRGYEARMLATFVDEPAQVTAHQMDRWARDFDSWAICDTACMHLFDRTPHAWDKVAQWSDARPEFVKRAAFALLASLAVHDKKSPDAPFLAALPLVERAATDERNFVKKAVSWALRGMGRRSARLHADSVALARRLAESTDAASRWIGKDALRDLTRPAVTRRLVEMN